MRMPAEGEGLNVPDGDYSVRGYKADLQLVLVDVTVNGSDVGDVNLVESTDPTATVSGTVQIVATTGITSVVLLVKATFDPSFVRGDAPAGLRVPPFGAADITGDWSISGVPDGEYVALAAFENDDLVRDESDIGGTAIVDVAVPDPTTGRTVTLPGFKVTAALTVVSPGAAGPEAVSEPPTFVWKDTPGEDEYHVKVFDALGTLVWETTMAKKSQARRTRRSRMADPLWMRACIISSGWQLSTPAMPPSHELKTCLVFSTLSRTRKLSRHQERICEHSPTSF